MRNAIFSFMIIGLLLSASSCDQTDRETGHVVAREGEPAVHMVSGEDPEMNSAIQQARSSVDTFITSLQNPAQNQTYFSVKAQIVDGVHSEHIWLYDVSFDGKQFQGKIGNNPLNVKNVSLGDDMRLEPSKISDWMIVEDNTLVGGYTIRVIRERLPQEERKIFDQNLPFRVN